MIKSIVKIGIVAALSITFAAMPLQLCAQTSTNAAPAKKVSKAHNRSGVMPFHGKLKALNEKEQTIKVGTRTFRITPDTKILKDGKTAMLADVIVGATVSGGYKKGADGKLTVTKLNIGPVKKKTKSKTKNSEAATK